MQSIQIFFWSYCSDGVVSMNEYMAFMISRETENVHSAKDVEEAFCAITDGGSKPYVTEEELHQVKHSDLQFFITAPTIFMCYFESISRVIE